MKTRQVNHQHDTGSRPILEHSWWQAVLVEMCEMRIYLTVSLNRNIRKYISKNLGSYSDVLINDD